MKRYNLNMPSAQYDQVKAVSLRDETDVATILRQYIALGLLLDDNREKKLIIEDENGNKEKIIIL